MSEVSSPSDISSCEGATFVGKCITSLNESVSVAGALKNAMLLRVIEDMPQILAATSGQTGSLVALMRAYVIYRCRVDTWF